MIELLRADCAYLALAGLALFAVCLGVLTFRATPNPGGQALEPQNDGFKADAVFWWLLGAVLVGLAVRLFHLDAKGLSHPEAYVPGLGLAPDISEPPLRQGLVETAKWHFNYEPHPFGWYMGMWAWTKVFGANLFTIRLPQALFGVASIPLIYRVGALSFGRRAGVIAACLLAIHGFHVFWSQAARMYVAGGFFGLLATWLLLEQYRRGRPGRLIELGYVAAIAACALTVEYAWVLLAVHLCWIALNQRKGASVPRPAFFATLAFILAAPMLAHALIGERENAASGESLQFLARFFSFGLLFQHGAFGDDPYEFPLIYQLAVLVVGAALAAIGLLRRPPAPDEARGGNAPPMWLLAVAAVGAALVMLAFAGIAHARNKRLIASAAAPLLALAFPIAAARLRPLATSLLPALGRLLDRLKPLTSLTALLAIMPVVVIALFSLLVVPVTAERAFLIFVPYILVVVAGGISTLFDVKSVRVPLTAGLGALFAASVLMLYATPNSPRDYQGIAGKMNAQMQPGDLVFLRPHSWIDTPVTYYLDHRRLVAADYVGATARNPTGRVWVVLWAQTEPYADMKPALAGYSQVGALHAEQAAALLFAPKSAAAAR